MKVIGALVSFNVLCLLFIVLGFVLDFTKKLQFGRTTVDEKFNTSKDGAAAAEHDMSHGAPSGKVPDNSQSSAFKEPTMNPIDKAADPADIVLEIEPASETPAKMIADSPNAKPVKKEEDGVSDVYGRPVTLG